MSRGRSPGSILDALRGKIAVSFTRAPALRRPWDGSRSPAGTSLTGRSRRPARLRAAPTAPGRRSEWRPRRARESPRREGRLEHARLDPPPGAPGGHPPPSSRPAEPGSAGIPCAPLDAPELRFVTRGDLRLGVEPVPLDIVFTVHPGIRYGAHAPGCPRSAAGEAAAGTPAVQTRAGAASDARSVFHALAANVLAEAFRSAVEEAPGAHSRIEELRRTASGRAPLAAELPPLCARALLVVDFRPCGSERPHLAGQLAVRLYSSSFGRYEEISLHNPRLLIFEDFAELAPAADPARFGERC